MSTIFNKNNNPEISSKTLVERICDVNECRYNIIDSINNTYYNYSIDSFLDNNYAAYIDPDKAKYIDQLINDGCLLYSTNLNDVLDIVPWQPVMQITRISQGGNGIISNIDNTDTKIEMYNNELSSNFFKFNDILNSNILAFSQDKLYTIPNSPIFSKYSEVDSKLGSLFVTPNTTAAGILFYQFTFPYDCYVCMSVSKQYSAIDFEGNSPVAFMITDGNTNNEQIIVAKTSADDGNGNNTDNSTYWASFHWHGYVKQGWKMYFADQNVNNASAWRNSGNTCLIFRVGQNSGQVNSLADDETDLYNIVQRLALHITNDCADYTATNENAKNNMVINTYYNAVSSDYFVASGTNLLNNGMYNTNVNAPNNQIFIKYSQINSKGGCLFNKPGKNTKGIWGEIKVKHDGYLSFNMGALQNDRVSEGYNDIPEAPGALIIMSPYNIERFSTTTCTSDNIYKSAIQYNGKVYKDETIYFAHIDTNTQVIKPRFLGLSLVLYDERQQSDNIISAYYDDITITQLRMGSGYTSVDDNQVLKNILASRGVTRKNLRFIKAETTEQSYVIISLYSPSSNCYYVITDNNNNLIDFGTSPSGGNSGRSSRQIVKILDANIKVYAVTSDASWYLYGSIAVCPIASI